MRFTIFDRSYIRPKYMISYILPYTRVQDLIQLSCSVGAIMSESICIMLDGVDTRNNILLTQNKQRDVLKNNKYKEKKNDKVIINLYTPVPHVSAQNYYLCTMWLFLLKTSLKY